MGETDNTCKEGKEKVRRERIDGNAINRTERKIMRGRDWMGGTAYHLLRAA